MAAQEPRQRSKEDFGELSESLVNRTDYPGKREDLQRFLFKLRTYAMRKMRKDWDPREVEDICHQAFIKFWDKLRAGKIKKFLAGAYAEVRTALGLHRPSYQRIRYLKNAEGIRKRVRSNHEHIDYDGEDEENGNISSVEKALGEHNFMLPEGELLEKELRTQTRRAFNQLPERQREILSCDVILGMSQQAIGDLLGLSANNVSKHKNRALTQMRNILNSDKY